MSADTYYLVSGEELTALQVSVSVAVDALNEVLAAGPASDVEVSARRARDGAARHLAVLADILAGVTPGNGGPAYRCTACGVVLTDGVTVHRLHCPVGGGRFFRVADRPVEGEEDQ